MRYIYLLIIAGLSFHSNALAISQEDGCIEQARSINQKLACLPNVDVQEVGSTILGAKQFTLLFEQPVDHTNPRLGTFKQRVALIHRSEEEPMVLQTSGYSIFSVAQAAITSLFKTNQIQIEHRYFSNSRPAVLDWSKLDIKQSADDFHKITVALKKIYDQPWVNTGASKGGMTSIYHRYFYPNDVAGTVADVAPLSFTTSDQRYVKFVNEVGGDAYKTCRENFKEIQKQLLIHRDQFVPQLTGNFNQLGSAALAFEHSVIESVFYFWQYGNPDSETAGCSSLPVNGSPEQMFDFLQGLAAIADYTDESIAKFLPYYYQAATQLGNPDNVTEHLEPLRQFEFIIDQYTPKGVDYTYTNQSMHEVANWVRTSADQIVFVYGEFDPWTAGEFPVSETGKTVEKYFVPKGNHGVKFTMLPNAEKQRVIRLLSAWFGKTPPKPAVKKDAPEETLEDIEFRARKHSKLP